MIDDRMLADSLAAVDAKVEGLLASGRIPLDAELDEKIHALADTFNVDPTILGGLIGSIKDLTDVDDGLGGLIWILSVIELGRIDERSST